MTRTTDRVALDAWYPVSIDAALPPGGRRETELLGEPIVVARDGEGIPAARTASGDALPVLARYGHLWTSLGTPPDLFAIPEAEEAGRRFVSCGRITLRASGLRIVENFLDMAHFPFVHPDLLGSEEAAEVKPYRAEIRAGVDEVWATECVFRQPRAALSAEGGIEAAYTYRVPSPFVALLLKSSPGRPGASDMVGIFMQPRQETLTDVYAFYYVFDDVNGDAEIAEFQQMIFLQDKSIVENQLPLRLPLDAGAEIPTRADAVSIAYRRWLKAKGLRFGAIAADRRPAA
jgi:phenylpropionate dioxygenase-like ring-hydroxylating dioxygenase large terminal subunit